MKESRKKLAWRLVGAVAGAFAASLVLTWVLHENMTKRGMRRIFERVFADVEVDIRERVDERMLHQAMVVRDRYYEMRGEAWWNDPDESSRRLRALADELGVDEICVADAEGLLTHSARRDEVGALDFRTAGGQAGEFAALLTDKSEVTQPLLPNSLRGERIKYVGVWLPDGGFVQVGGRENAVRNLARTAVTGLTHGWHVNGDNGGIFITTGNGTIISHPEAGHEGGQWRDPGEDFYCEKRMIEGFPVYIVTPKRTAIVERRVLVGTSAFLNAAALVLAAVLVGLVITRWARARARALRAKELALAADIQVNAIPRVFPPFPEEKRMDLFASMQPARDVGGDFYDFFFSGADRLVFLVADVSDKGVPAALFMMRAETILKGLAQTGRPIAEAVAEANNALCEGNAADMFVTAWIGELDLATGRVTCVNAGHNPPVLLRAADGSASFVETRPGLFLGAMPGVRYRPESFALAPGDALYLYTDGVTEQADPRGGLYGEKRLLAFLAGGGFAGNPGKCPAAVLADVEAHAAGAEQSDDRTQLVVRWRGPAGETA
jgi:serine phosphatase RsbU (regulator of sigma subunit)